VQSRVVRIDVPIMVAASIGLWVLSLNGGLSFWDGAVLFAVLVTYIVWSIREGRGEDPAVQEEFAGSLARSGRSQLGHLGRQVGLVLAGLVVLAISARILVDGATDIARGLGVSDLVIGLTVVAVGTSLPELVASVVASLRGERDIAVGNVVGSNLFNILGVLGIGAMVAPDGIPVSEQVIGLDLPIMIATTVACLPIFFTGRRISRLEGGLFLGYFLAYMAYVVMGATDASYMRSFELGMLGFVIPLTVIAIAFSVFQSFQHRREGRAPGGVD
jgi:cation:H+ antiporter